MTNPALLSLLSCPQCDGTDLDSSKEKWICRNCKSEYPIIGDVPWLQRDALYQVEQWKGRFQALVKSWVGEEDRIKKEISNSNIRGSTRQRLSRLLQAKVEHRKEVQDLLAPLSLNLAGTIDREMAFRSTLPESMHLMGYNANVFRDWGWETDENQQCLDLFKKTTGLSSLAGATLLTLGAGAGRFPYDLHFDLKPTMSVTCDINPLLLMVARKLMRGGTVTFNDFPIAPIDDESAVVRHKLKAPHRIKDNFHIIAADGVNFPGREQAFDWVITPWFIDIVGADTALLAERINRLLKPGGRWYNFGTLVYQHRNLGKNYSKAEVREVVAEAGFGWESEETQSIPYLQDPASAQKRWEQVWAFVVQKQRDVASRSRIDNWPSWLTNVHEPVPKLLDLDRTIAINASYNLVMHQVDGKRSIGEIAAFIAPHFEFSQQEATAMLRQLLMRVVESTARDQKF